MAIQRQNAEMVDLLAAHFMRRLEPNVAWGMAPSGVLLPQLRGYWPMSSVDELGDVYDMSEQDRVLDDKGGLAYGTYGLAPYAIFNGASQHLSRLDEPGLSITAGFTVAGWFWFDDDAGINDEVCMAKWNDGGNLWTFNLRRLNAVSLGVARFEVSSGWPNRQQVSSVGTTLDDDRWYFLAGRFDPSTEVKLWVDDATFTLAAAVYAAVQDNASDFSVGAYADPANYLDGRASLCWLCAAVVPDVIVNAWYQWTRRMFNK